MSNPFMTTEEHLYWEGKVEMQQNIEKIQTEIESLTKDYQELTEMYIQQGKTIYELQKRIDEALDHTINHGGYDDLTHIINILKGE